MPRRLTPLSRRATAILLALSLALAGLVALSPDPAGAQLPLGNDYEIWALDQGEGVDKVFIYSSDLERLDEIDLGSLRNADGAQLVDTPHMIDFDSQYRYAFIASTRSGNVTIVRTDDRQVVDVIDTGAGAHAAVVTPDDSAAWVANINAGTFNEITIDYDNEEFALSGREVVIKEDPLYDDALFPTPFVGPICHDFTPDGRKAYLTLGPGTGGLAVIDLETARIEKLFPQADVKANCGVAITRDGTTAWSNWGAPVGVQPEGELYRFDVAGGHELVETVGTRGVDAHGVRLTPDESELWLVNRETSDGVIVDTATGQVVEELDRSVVGPVPDIIDFAPDGSRAFISLRGPQPRSGAHQAVGEDPGFAVVDVATREQIAIVRPNEGDVRSDFHGIGVRVLPESSGRDVTVTRLAGEDRVGTAVAISAGTFLDGTAGGAVIARADNFPDALAGTPLAAQVDGPVLITPRERLAPPVARELERVLAPDATVYLLGGVEALRPGVERELVRLGYDVERIGGADRYETAVRIAERIQDPALQIVTTGEDFPDALTAGAAAVAHDGVVVLTPAGRRAPATDAYLTSLAAPERVAVGGPAARQYPGLEPVFGEDRQRTALAVGRRFFPDGAAVALAREDLFPDALAGGLHAGVNGAPLLLTPTATLSPFVSEELCERGPAVDRVFAYGGPLALAESVLETAANRVTGQGCAAAAVTPTTVSAEGVYSRSVFCHLPVNT